MAEKMLRDEQIESQPAINSLRYVIPSRMDTLEISPKARKLLEERIKQLKEEKEKIPVPGSLKDDKPVSDSELRHIMRETGFNIFEKFLCKAALEGDKQKIEEAKKEIIKVGDMFHQPDRAKEIINKFEEIIKIK